MPLLLSGLFGQGSEFQRFSEGDHAMLQGLYVRPKSVGAGVGGAVWLTKSGRVEVAGGLKVLRVESLPVDQIELLKDQGLRAFPKMA